MKLSQVSDTKKLTSFAVQISFQDHEQGYLISGRDHVIDKWL